jgi:exonuclease 1
MGITGLLQALQPIATDLNIAALANKAVAIDAYCWLHRGAYACAMELAQNQKTDV